jgi:hypothetical protein
MKYKHILTLGLALVLSLSASAQSDAQKSFDKLKALAGSWEGTMEGAPLHVSLRVTSMGSAIMHEIKGGGPEDPITMLTVDGDRLLLTHYCDRGNQPRMAGTGSPDGKTITFNFIDATNLQSSQGGHMQNAVFTLIDSDHHTEKWEFQMADGKPMGATFDLRRSK